MKHKCYYCERLQNEKISAKSIDDLDFAEMSLTSNRPGKVEMWIHIGYNVDEDEDNITYQLITFNINNCPMCGRVLGKE